MGVQSNGWKSYLTISPAFRINTETQRDGSHSITLKVQAYKRKQSTNKKEKLTVGYFWINCLTLNHIKHLMSPWL